MRIRMASFDDLDTLVGFIHEEAREAEGLTIDRATLEAGIRAALEDNSIAVYWILVDDIGTPCGCTSIIKEWSDWNARNYWWIQSMYITPEHRGKGYIQVMLDSITEAAREQDCLELRLYVHNSNTSAIRAYEKVGFEHSPYKMMSQSI